MIYSDDNNDDDEEEERSISEDRVGEEEVMIASSIVTMTLQIIVMSGREVGEKMIVRAIIYDYRKINVDGES